MSGPAVNVPEGIHVYLDQEQGTRQIRSAKTGELLREITNAELVAANRLANQNYLQRAIDAEFEKMNSPWQPPEGGSRMAEPRPINRWAWAMGWLVGGFVAWAFLALVIYALAYLVWGYLGANGAIAFASGFGAALVGAKKKR